MPFKSVAQRRAMFRNAPAVARRWAHKYGAKAGGGFTKAQLRRSRSLSRGRRHK